MELAALLTAFVYYAYLLFGGICLGYIFLRLTHPETRVLESRNKLSKSFLAGIVLVGLAVLADWLYSGSDAVVSVSGLTPLFALLITVIALVGFNIASSFGRRSFLVVGVPVSRQSPGLRRLLPLVQEVIVKPSAVPAQPATPPSSAPVAAQPAVTESAHGMWMREGREAAASAASAVSAPVPEKKGGGFFEKIFGGKPKQPAASEKPKKKTEDADIEVMIRELRLVQEPPKQQPGGKGQQTQKPGVPQQPADRHRLYLQKGAAAAPAAGARASTSDASKEEREELNALFQDVYSKLQADQKPETLKEKIGPKVPPKLSQAARGAAEEKGLSMADLLGAEKTAPAAPSAPSEYGSLFSQLEQISGEKKQEGDVQLVKMRVDQNPGCPTCHSKNSRIIFCPYCGTGLCANCAPSVKPGIDAFVYTCPKCGEDVSVKRKNVS